jgi:hypothetical protein
MTRKVGAALAALMISALVIPFALAAGNDDRATAEALVKTLDADAAHKTLVADTLGKAHAALERARRMRAAGDEEHARLADGLAREWAEMARDLVKADDAEKRANAARSDALDAGAQLERERAMLEESVTRTGRLRAELAAAEREAQDTNRNVTAVMDAGAKKQKQKQRARDDKKNDQGEP